MTTKTMLIALALAAAALANTTLLNGSASAGVVKVGGPPLTAPSRLVGPVTVNANKHALEDSRQVKRCYKLALPPVKVCTF